MRPGCARIRCPAGKTSLSRWDQLNALGLSQRDQVLAATTAPAGATVSIRLADLFASAQDEAAIEAAGLKPVQPLLAIIDRIKRPKDIATAVAALHAAGMPVLVDLKVLRDNQGNPYAQVGPGGLGLPDPGFYASTDPLVQPVEVRYSRGRGPVAEAGRHAGRQDGRAGGLGRPHGARPGQGHAGRHALPGDGHQGRAEDRRQHQPRRHPQGPRPHRPRQVAVSSPGFFRALDTADRQHQARPVEGLPQGAGAARHGPDPGQGLPRSVGAAL